MFSTEHPFDSSEWPGRHGSDARPFAWVAV